MLSSDPYIFAMQLENPRMTWAESFELKGMREGTYPERHWFETRCKLCGKHSQESYETAFEAKIEHFKHCSRQHHYVFPEDADIKQADGQLQQAIIVSMLYDLPLPGYETHKDCVKQYRDNKIVCIIHY